MSLGSRGYAGPLERAGTRCRVSNENILMSALSDRFKAIPMQNSALTHLNLNKYKVKIHLSHALYMQVP